MFPQNCKLKVTLSLPGYIDVSKRSKHGVFIALSYLGNPREFNAFSERFEPGVNRRKQGNLNDNVNTLKLNNTQCFYTLPKRFDIFETRLFIQCK